MSITPDLSWEIISFDSAAELNLDNAASFIGKPEYLAEKVLKCC